MQLENRVALIVGAGQTAGETIGNGRAVALAFARAGAKLVLADINRESAIETLQLLQSEGFDGQVITLDVTNESSCADAITFTLAEHGQLDILHYNVGRSDGDAEPASLEAEQWDQIMAMNLKGFMLCCKYTLPIMRKQQNGVIIGISSAAAIAHGDNVTYKASKAGMNALVQSMAVSNGRYNIRVNAIMPGLMDTPMAIERRARQMNISRDEVRDLRHRLVPLNRKMGTAWDVASAALFLASDDAGYISGVSLPVDGALTARVG